MSGSSRKIEREKLLIMSDKSRNSIYYTTGKYLLVLCYLGFIIFGFHRFTNDSKPIHIYPMQSRFSSVVKVGTSTTRDNITELSSSNGEILTRLPHQIFMLWDKGWANAPLMQRVCMNSFRRKNPEFELRLLNLSYAEQLIDRRQFYSDNAWRSASIQSKSDIIRLELLTKYGGIWADASVYCNEPLLKWLNDSLLGTGFLAYERKDPYVNEFNAPWISSWFMVSMKDSPIIRIWRDTVREAWKEARFPNLKYGYYWLHRIFRSLVINNTVLGEQYRTTPIMNANGPHCYKPKEIPHMYKLRAEWCGKTKANILAKDKNVHV